MRRTTTLMTTAILALSIAPALQAQPQDRYQPRDRDQERGRYSYPETRHVNRVAAIAHEIEQNATYIRREFERNNRRPDRDEARAIDTLNQLNAEADRFHDEVERYRRSPRRSADEFASLERAFNTTERSLRRIDRRPYVDRGMVRIYTLMNELSSYYGRRSGYYGTWDHDRDDRGDRDRDHGRYDRDRNDRDRDRDHDGHDDDHRPPYNF
jgi:hypothetical protein